MLSQESLLSTPKVRDNQPLSNIQPEGVPRHPLEYYGKKLDNSGAKALIQGQYFDLKRELVAKAYDLVQMLETVDVGPFQLELIPPDFTDKESEVLGRIAVYLRSHNIGEIRLTKKRGTFRTTKNEPPALTLVCEFVVAFKAFITSHLDDDAINRLSPPPGQVCVGVGGERALVLCDKLHLKLSEGRVPDLQWLGGTAIVGPFRLEMQQGGGIGYNRKAVVRYGGRLFGMVLWDASFAGLKETAKLEIDNAEIYRSYDSGLKESIENFVSLMNSEVIGVFRVDVAFDSPGVMTFLKRVHNREIMLVRQSAYHKAKKIVGLATNAIEGFSCGPSYRFFRVYDKTKELRDNRKTKDLGYKAHIDGEFWPLNGLQTANSIGRLEGSFANSYLKTVEGFKWEDLFDRGNLVALFNTAAKNVFEWVPTEHNDSKINRRPRVEYLDFSEVDTEPYQRCYPEPVRSDRMDKITAKKLFVDAAFADDASTSQTFLNAAADIIEDNNLHCWLSGKVATILEAVGDRMVETNTPCRNDWEQEFEDLATYSQSIARMEAAKPKMTLLALSGSALSHGNAWNVLNAVA